MLRNIPYTLAIAFRFQLFKSLWEIYNYKHGGNPSYYAFDPKKLSVRRGNEFEDAFQVFSEEESFFDLADFNIVFTDEFGMREAGIDGGGLFREFIFEVFRKVFNPVFGLFVSTSSGDAWYPNPNSFLTSGESLSYYKFLGVIVGCALSKGILLPVSFSETFMKRLFKISPQFDELNSFDPQLFKNLLLLKQYDGDVSSFGLTFSIVDDSKPCIS